jgi:hypothetical protein
MNRIITSLVRVVLLPALFLSLACVSIPPPPREAEDLSVIGIAANISQPLWSNKQADYVYFVRLYESGTYEYNDPIRSNYASGDYVYLFNAQPGRYAAVSVGYVQQTQSAPMGSSVGLGGGFSMSYSVSSTSTSNHTTYLPKALVEETVVTVGPAEVAFIGEITLDKRDWEEADDLQLHYYELMAPGHKDMGFWAKAFSGQGGHNAGAEPELDQSRESQDRFLDHSQEEFANAEWEGIFRNPIASEQPPR